MRRHDRELEEPAAILAIIASADSCRLGLIDDTGSTPLPYIVALNHAYEPAGADGLRGVFWFHGAQAGRKLDLIRRNPQACVQLDCDHEPVKNVFGCGWGMKFASVLATGLARIAVDRSERQHGLECLMAHYLRLWGPVEGSSVDAPMPPLQDRAIDATAVFRVDVDSLTAKRKP